jgi:ligand-binding sensor domain-containing protein
MVDGSLRPFLAPKLNGETIAVDALRDDRQGNLWVETDGQGLYRIRGTDVDHYGIAEGLSSDGIRGNKWTQHHFEDREGNVWVVTAQELEMFRDLRVKGISKTRRIE